MPFNQIHDGVLQTSPDRKATRTLLLYSHNYPNLISNDTSNIVRRHLSTYAMGGTQEVSIGVARQLHTPVVYLVPPNAAPR
jgi:hypothetical protein